MMDKSGYSEIGYILTYIIAGIVLASIFSISTEMSTKNSRTVSEELLWYFTEHIGYAIDETILLVSDNHNITINKTIELPVDVGGYNTVLYYTIEATNNTVYVNTTAFHISMKYELHNPGFIYITGSVQDCIYIGEKTAGTTVNINIIYDKTNNVISIRKC